MNNYPWIQRNATEGIFEAILTNSPGVNVLLIESSAGVGKTFLTRDIGTRLGSESGYEPSRQERMVWSGILDIYDPDTNSNKGIEQRLIEALPAGNWFDTYHSERALYDAWFKGGIVGSNLEVQRQKVEQSFAAGLSGLSRQWYPVLAFDTVERLESGTDPTQRAVEIFDDTASVMGWLIFQITHLERGTIFLVGRPAKRFEQTLIKHIRHANEERLPELQIHLTPIELLPLDPAEQARFFAYRRQNAPKLRELLTPSLEKLLIESTKGNPLLLDIALQTLLETSKPAKVEEGLRNKKSVEEVTHALFDAYATTGSVEHIALLNYLALARMGLFDDLLRAMEASRAERLISELQKLESLPFIKVRDVYVASPGEKKKKKRRTYFLHDAMYQLCDQLLVQPEQVMRESQHIVKWYDQQIAKFVTKSRKSDPDLLVESVFYRMRANPVEGYQWYLRESDLAIRSAETSLDMRLRDAMCLFLASASVDEAATESLSISSVIDRTNIQTLMPNLFDDFTLDSAMLWIKRSSFRGKSELSKTVGEKLLPVATKLYESNPERYKIPLAELCLWYGQAIMYGSSQQKAIAFYQQIIEQLGDLVNQVGEGSATGFNRWRLYLVLGRAYNNLGYTNWMYLGKLQLAIKYFHQAIGLYRLANLDEELANSIDNMGRVYAQLGQSFQSLQLIRDGLELRKEAGLVYREALSANSLAIAYIQLDQATSAIQIIEDALRKFRLAGAERGIGLGLITKGIAHRHLAESWRENDIPLETALRQSEQSESDLQEALKIFTTSVREPLRTVQVYNELACCYRARYLLKSRLETPSTEGQLELIASQARANFRKAIDLAQQNNYVIEMLDSIQDLAVLYFRSQQYAEAQIELDKVKSNIPDSHLIKSGEGFATLSENERINTYYKLMGQVELLQGGIIFEQGCIKLGTEDNPTKVPPTEDLFETARHYLLAVAYFNQFSSENYAHRQSYARIYKRFRYCRPDEVKEITQIYLPQWIGEYHIAQQLVSSLFTDVFGLFAQGDRGI